MDINLITVSGHVVKSPTSTRSDGVLYANFSLAVSSGSKELPKTLWYSISTSEKMAETILNHINAGDKLFIIGRPSIDTYLDKNKQIIGVQKIWLERFEFGSSKAVEVQNIAPPDLVDNELATSFESQIPTH